MGFSDGASCLCIYRPSGARTSLIGLQRLMTNRTLIFPARTSAARAGSVGSRTIPYMATRLTTCL